MKFENPFPRAASVIAVTSRTSPGPSMNRGTGAHSLVSLLTISAVPTPQFGWQPQESAPHCDSELVTSRTSPGPSMNRGTGAHSLVSLLTISAVPTPQFGWQPQESAPHCDS